MRLGYVLGSMLVVGALATGVAGAAPPAAPLLDLAEAVVAPGETLRVTILGAPGHHFALAASGEDAGLTVGAVALDLGADARVLATGRLDATGRAVVRVPAEFPENVTRLHLQAVTAPTAAFEGLAATPGKVVRDLRPWLAGSAGTTPRGAGAEGSGPWRPLLAAALRARGGGLACEGCVGTDNLADRAVTTAKLAEGAVTAAQVAPGSLTSVQLAPGVIGSAQIDPAQVQARVGGTCPSGQYLRGVNADGTVQCEPFLALPVSTTVGADISTLYHSIAIGSDGLPIISHASSDGGGSLRITHCGNVARTAGNFTIPVDDPADPVGPYSSIAIGTDGLPIISHQSDESDGGLRVTHCGNVTCTAGNVSTTVDDRPSALTSIAIGIDGLPIMSHQANDGDFSLRVTKCATRTCQ